jgi:cyclic 2,3-diphosphoglycerate synthetase
VKVIALIDGEHHPGVVRDALDRLADDHEVSAVLFAGGEEKVSAAVLEAPVAHYGRPVTIPGGPVRDSLRDLASELRPDAVVDLSGDPVLDWNSRLGIASMALHLGASYRAPGVTLEPPRSERLPYGGPVIAVIGTGKRTGKTAVGGHYAALLRSRMVEPVVLSMGRGGPAEPELVPADEAPDLAALKEIVRQGRHAASDYLEDAVLSGAACVGARRCGEGLTGEPFDSNVLEGAMLALSVEPDVLLVEGSGATVPPIHSHRTVCVTDAARAATDALSFLGPYRLLRSHLVVLVGADSMPSEDLIAIERALSGWARDGVIVGCTLEPEPAAPVREGARAAVFTTASPEFEQRHTELLEGHGVDVRVFSSSLSRRGELARDLERAERERCDIFLTELKAAAIEVVASEAERSGAEVVFLRNRPVSLPGEPDLDEELLRIHDEAVAESERRETAAAGGR